MSSTLQLDHAGILSVNERPGLEAIGVIRDHKRRAERAKNNGGIGERKKEGKDYI